MPDKSAVPGRSPSPGSLDARVEARLAQAGAAFDRRARAARPGRGRGKPSMPAPAERERATLRAVFHELGEAHRAYRARTGGTVTPALRDATTAFKAQPSALTLVGVAAFLDELGILAW